MNCSQEGIRISTEYQRRPERINALIVQQDNVADAAALVGGHVESGTLIVPLFGEGSAVPVSPGSYVWADEMGPHVEVDPDRFSTMWAEVNDGPTLRKRIEKLESAIGIVVTNV